MKLINPDTGDNIGKPSFTEIWYNRNARSWVIQLMDDNFNQIDSWYSGTKEGILFYHDEWVREFNLNEKHIKEMRKKYKEYLKDGNY